MRGSSRNHQFLSLPEIVSLYYLDLNFFLEMEMERRGEGRRGVMKRETVSKCPSVLVVSNINIVEIM